MTKYKIGMWVGIWIGRVGTVMMVIGIIWFVIEILKILLR